LPAKKKRNYEIVRESAPSPIMKANGFDSMIMIDEHEELAMRIEDNIESPIKLADVMRAEEDYDSNVFSFADNQKSSKGSAMKNNRNKEGFYDSKTNEKLKM